MYSLPRSSSGHRSREETDVKLVHQYQYMCNGLIDWKNCFFGTIFTLCWLLKYYICLSCSYFTFYINAVLTVKSQITMTVVLFKTPWPRTKGWIVRRDNRVDLDAYSLQIAKEWVIGPGQPQKCGTQSAHYDGDGWFL